MNQAANTVRDLGPKWAATGRSPAYTTDSTPVKCSSRTWNRWSTRSTIHGRANRSIRPVLRYWADFHRMSVRSARGSRSSKTNRISPRSRPRRRSFFSVVLAIPGYAARSHCA